MTERPSMPRAVACRRLRRPRGIDEEPLFLSDSEAAAGEAANGTRCTKDKHTSRIGCMAESIRALPAD
jgi:hypothetical protein